MTNEEIKLLKNFITWQSLPFVDNLFTHEDEIIKKFDEWLKLNVVSDDRMTNQEAIIWIKSIKDKYIHGGDDDFDEKRKKSLDMAIKALKQTSHLIARPCEMCEFYTEDGCSKWGCVFEKRGE